MSTQPPLGGSQVPEPPRSSSSRTVLIVLGVVGVVCLMCCGGLALLLFPAINAARQSGIAAVCMSNERQIGMAILNYESVKGHLPPAYIADENGKPMHSWRVLILPFLEEDALFQQYDMNEPWDGPNNRKLANMMPAVFRCPAAPPGLNSPNFLAVVGPEAAWHADGPVKGPQIIDGRAKTILLVEVENAGFNWLEPKDLSFTEAARGINPADKKLGISSPHSHGPHAIMCDGHFVRLSPTNTPEQLRGLLTIDGREQVEPDGE